MRSCCSHAAQGRRRRLEQRQLEVPDCVGRYLQLVGEQRQEGRSMTCAGAGRGLLRVLGDGREDGRQVSFGVDFEAVAADFPRQMSQFQGAAAS